VGGFGQAYATMYGTEGPSITGAVADWVMMNGLMPLLMALLRSQMGYMT
jgi:hypothetical protein